VSPKASLAALCRAPARLLERARLPEYSGLRPTAKRFLNYQLVRLQQARGHTRLLGYPLVITVEATNVCNLECPYCFTGAGEAGRRRSMMSLEMFGKLMDELGDYALMVEFHNWGEPMLHKKLPDMIRMASSRGISTVVSTNFSLPFDRARAEAIVSSGLAILGVSIDGATQESYEKYRVGGKLETVLANVRLVNEAKRALGVATPSLSWSFHVFEHNWRDVPLAGSMAKELGMEFVAAKGWVAGPEWDSGGSFDFWVGTSPARCRYLWTQAIINNDGRTAPCCATFYDEDDYGVLENTRFRDVWNNDKFRDARRMFRSRSQSTYKEKLICYDCPYTVIWEQYQRHRAEGGAASAFRPAYTTNDWFNYFFSRRPQKEKAAASH
jgi:MoaA/NifB/PqqE/SkfB family radical SAM enzyme